MNDCCVNLLAELAAAKATAKGAHDAAQLVQSLREREHDRAERYRRRAFAMRRALTSLRKHVRRAAHCAGLVQDLMIRGHGAAMGATATMFDAFSDALHGEER